MNIICKVMKLIKTEQQTFHFIEYAFMYACILICVNINSILFFTENSPNLSELKIKISQRKIKVAWQSS